MTNLIDLMNDILGTDFKVQFFKNNTSPKKYKISFDIDDINEAVIPEEIIPRGQKRVFDLTGKDEILKKYIESFMEMIEANYSEKDLNYYHKNINDLKVNDGFNFKYFLIRLLISNSAGFYDSQTNEIRINNYKEDSLETNIFHELFHMASTFNGSNVIYVGFNQYNKNTSRSIGDGINEGYTEFLAQKHSSEDSTRISYPYEIQVINILKDIIGEEKMTSLYLTGNLKGLISELSKYSSVDEVIEFIVLLDSITKNHYLFCDRELLREIERRKEKVDLFLAKIYFNSKESEIEEKFVRDKNSVSNIIEDYINIIRQGPKNNYISPEEDEYNVSISTFKKILKENGYYTKTNSVVHR